MENSIKCNFLSNERIQKLQGGNQCVEEREQFWQGAGDIVFPVSIEFFSNLYFHQTKQKDKSHTTT